jgi:hypothetical protein
VTGVLSVILPASNKPPALWRAEALPTLKLEGEIALKGTPHTASFRSIPRDVSFSIPTNTGVCQTLL